VLPAAAWSSTVAGEGFVVMGGYRAEFTDVEVLKADDVIVLCRVYGKVVGIPTHRMLPGTTIGAAEVGTTGRLVISHEMALNLGLLLPWP
jgi:hypothetical protein